MHVESGTMASSVDRTSPNASGRIAGGNHSPNTVAMPLTKHFSSSTCDRQGNGWLRQARQ
jgi:hypothetical protein